MTKLPTLYGLILNGGASSRMKTPKGTIRFHDKPQYQHLFDVLSPLCEKVYVSVKLKSESLPLPQIEDQLKIQSPLNGIFSALKVSASTAWLVVANDMPLVDTETLQTLIHHRDPSRVAACFYDSSGKRPEPLISIWEPASVPLLETFIENGKISPRQFLEEHDIRIIPINDNKALLNINSPEDLARFRKDNQ